MKVKCEQAYILPGFPCAVCHHVNEHEEVLMDIYENILCSERSPCYPYTNNKVLVKCIQVDANEKSTGYAVTFFKHLFNVFF